MVGPKSHIGTRAGTGNQLGLQRTRECQIFVCATDQNQKTEHGNLQRVSVLIASSSVCVSGGFVSMCVFKMELAGENADIMYRGCRDGLGSRAV